MGDIADMMLEGDMCQMCGEIMDGDGYPQICPACQEACGVDEHGEKRSKPAEKVPCPVCSKRVKEAGLSMHMRDVHGYKPSEK